jgi:hypothetical protein
MAVQEEFFYLSVRLSTNIQRKENKMYKASREFIKARQKYSKYKLMVLDNVKSIGGGELNKCFDNAHKQKVKAKKEGKDVMCISGWLVQPYNLKTRSVAIIQHWWNVDEDQNHFDSTPTRSDEEYVLDFDLYEFARINHDLISSNIGRSLLYQNGKFELLIDEEKMLFLEMDLLLTQRFFRYLPQPTKEFVNE